jgi:predicted HAD superfamily Cof-like phosphohydrolase
MTLLSDAQEFRKAFFEGMEPSMAMQMRLIAEEANEVEEAVFNLYEEPMNNVHKAALLKELADLVYVCYQMAAAFDWDLDVAMKRVHTSNMSKLVDGRPIRRNDGKVLKPATYIAPSVIDLV